MSSNTLTYEKGPRRSEQFFRIGFVVTAIILVVGALAYVADASYQVAPFGIVTGFISLMAYLGWKAHTDRARVEFGHSFYLAGGISAVALVLRTWVYPPNDFVHPFGAAKLVQTFPAWWTYIVPALVAFVVVEFLRRGEVGGEYTRYLAATIVIIGVDLFVSIGINGIGLTGLEPQSLLTPTLEQRLYVAVDVLTVVLAVNISSRFSSTKNVERSWVD